MTYDMRVVSRGHGHLHGQRGGLSLSQRSAMEGLWV